MAKTYTPIATYTVGSAQSTITFNSLGSYTDIRIVASMQDGNYYGLLRFNGDTGTNYSRTWMYGNGSGAYSSRTSNATSGYWGATPSGSDFIVNEINVMNYGNSSTYKSTLIRQSGTSDQAGAYVYLWRSTLPITSISFVSASGSATIASGSTITVYGIQAA